MIYWSELQTSFLEEYSIQTIFPIHLQLLTLPGTVVAIVWLFCANLRQQNSDENDRTKELNHHPQFVRVFLFDSNYDLQLKSTEAEETKAQKDQGKIDVNTVTRESDSNSTKQEIQNESNNRITQEIINRLKNLEGSLTELKDTKKMMMDKLQSMEESLKHGSRNDMNGS
ncbi:uncharacterized protein LOC127732453 isoform X12 [Mytilus californianus]|nr:uncharacterized protein LOC127732453 isoform X12 [Mytilus californianus]